MKLSVVKPARVACAAPATSWSPSAARMRFTRMSSSRLTGSKPWAANSRSARGAIPCRILASSSATLEIPPEADISVRPRAPAYRSCGIWPRRRKLPPGCGPRPCTRRSPRRRLRAPARLPSPRPGPPMSRPLASSRATAFSPATRISTQHGAWPVRTMSTPGSGAGVGVGGGGAGVGIRGAHGRDRLRRGRENCGRALVRPLLDEQDARDADRHEAQPDHPGADTPLPDRDRSVHGHELPGLLEPLPGRLEGGHPVVRATGPGARGTAGETCARRPGWGASRNRPPPGPRASAARSWSDPRSSRARCPRPTECSSAPHRTLAVWSSRVGPSARSLRLARRSSRGGGVALRAGLRIDAGEAGGWRRPATGRQPRPTPRDPAISGLGQQRQQSEGHSQWDCSCCELLPAGPRVSFPTPGGGGARARTPGCGSSSGGAAPPSP